MLTLLSPGIFDLASKEQQREENKEQQEMTTMIYLAVSCNFSFSPSPSVGGVLVDDGLLGNGSLICDGLFVDELVREGAVPPVLSNLP